MELVKHVSINTTHQVESNGASLSLAYVEERNLYEVSHPALILKVLEMLRYQKF